MFYRRYGKRVFDLALAVPGLVLLSPLLCLIAVAIKLTSRGPVFYVQERIGRNAVPFPFIKFRTMVVGAESQGAGSCVSRTIRASPGWAVSFAASASTRRRSWSTSCAAR